jgi:CRP-like cAMP-binding protein
MMTAYSGPAADAPGSVPPLRGAESGELNSSGFERVRDRAHRPGFWSSLTQEEQHALAASARGDTFGASTTICRENEAARHVLVIQSGWVKVCVEKAAGERILAVRGPGDLVGERAVLLVRYRSATVITLDTVQALLLTTEAFAAFLEDHPRVLAVLEREVYNRLTEDRGPLTGETADAEQRMAPLILELALRQSSAGPSGQTFTLPISHQELADWVDMSVEAVGRALTLWHEQGMVRSSPNRLTVLDLAGLERICGRDGRPQSPSVPSWAGHNCSILLVDVAAFGDTGRDDDDRRVVVHNMYEILRHAFDASDVPWEQCHREDRGDGALIVVPPGIPTISVVDPLLAWLAAALRRYNHQASAPVRIQLRAALHVGSVTSGPQGVSGEAIIQAARLLEAPVLKERLSETGADLGFIASSFVYDNVIKHGPGYVDPVTYQQVEVQVKESKLNAWMHLAGAITEAGPSRPRALEPQPVERPQAGAVFSGEVHVQGDFVLGNKIEYRS